MKNNKNIQSERVETYEYTRIIAVALLKISEMSQMSGVVNLNVSCMFEFSHASSEE